MSYWVKKLKNKRGGTMVISLMYFMFAAVVGGFVVSSTHGTTYRLARLRQESQSYHDAKSALNLVVDMFSRMSYTFELWERRTLNKEGSELVYFLESIYPRAIGYNTFDDVLNDKTADSEIDTKTYPIGKFKVEDEDVGGPITKFFYNLFSNHTVAIKKDGATIIDGKDKDIIYAKGLVGNDLANMFVTTDGTYHAFPEVFPKVSDDAKVKNKDNQMGSIFNRFIPVYPELINKYSDKNDVDATKVAEFYGYTQKNGSADDFGTRKEAFTDIVLSDKMKSGNNTNSNKTIDEIDLIYSDKAGVGEQSNNGATSADAKTSQQTLLGQTTHGTHGRMLKNSLTGIAKSSANEYTFKLIPDEANSTHKFGEYEVKIKFVSNNEKAKDNPSVTVKPEDLFICIIEVKDPKTNAVHTATSKVTVTAKRYKKGTADQLESDNSQDGQNGQGENDFRYPARTEVTMQWKDWRNVHNTVSTN